MLKNYLKVTVRNLLKNKGYFAINLLGLTIGIACALLIFVVVCYEMSFDAFHTKADRIYRVGVIQKDKDGKQNLDGSSHYSLAPAIRNEFADLKLTTVRHDGSEMLFSVKDDLKNTEQKYLENQSGFVEPEFFDIFDFPMLQGDAKAAIKEPNTVILTEKIAEKFFGNESAIGKFIRWDGRIDFKVTGIAKDFPSNTSLPFEILMSYATVSQIEDKETLGHWNGFWSDIQTFALLPDSYKPSQFDAQMPAFGKKYIPEEDQKRRQYYLQPLAEVHFATEMSNFANRTASTENLWALGIVAIFLILTACINFINLATAQAVKRSKEVGIRKVLGSSRFALIQQFFGETLLITLFSVLLASGIADFLLDYMNQLMGLTIEKRFLWNIQSIVFLGILTFIVSLLSGFYPALVLSGFKPILAIKNSITSNHAGGMNLRRGLIVMQFAISQILITCTIIAIQQMDFFRTKDLGFDKEAVITVNLPKNDSLRFESLKAQLKQLSEIEKVSLSFAPPAANSNWTTSFRLLERGDERFSANMKMSDIDYIDTYSLKLLAGRNFGEGDTMRDIVVNEELVKQLGFKTPQDALGKSITLGRQKASHHEIVGIIKDFHNYSLHTAIAPIIIATNRGAYNIASIKLNAKNLTAVLPKIEKIWTGVFPEYVYTYQFLDQRIAEFYTGEERQANLFKIFALIAIFIGCIGLYGLVSFMIAQKTKEIGIRKVLGASIGQIVFIFSKEFAKLLLVAFLLASPLVYYVMKTWLENFTYRIDLNVGIFLIAIVASALIAALTVGYKSIRAATVNPVKSLKTE